MGLPGLETYEYGLAYFASVRTRRPVPAAPDWREPPAEVVQMTRLAGGDTGLVVPHGGSRVREMNMLGAHGWLLEAMTPYEHDAEPWMAGVVHELLGEGAYVEGYQVCRMRRRLS